MLQHFLRTNKRNSYSGSGECWNSVDFRKKWSATILLVGYVPLGDESKIVETNDSIKLPFEAYWIRRVILPIKIVSYSRF